MSDQNAGTPRVYLARHGETEWTVTGQYTGVTDLDLTKNGIQQVVISSQMLVGLGKLIDPSRLARIFISPLKRAQTTFRLLFEGEGQNLSVEEIAKTTDQLTELNYGDYEGLTTKEIRQRRKEGGLDKERPWDIWRDGCEGGESVQQITGRLDGLISKIRDLQRPWMRGGKPADIVLVAHGHILRAFAKRWLGYSLDFPLSMMIEPGGIGILSYQHHNVDEPAFLLGMAFPYAQV